MAKRNAKGNGNIRRRKDGTFEARFTYQDELGQPQRGSVYAKTQKECRKKLTAVLKQIDEGTYRKTTKHYTVAQWFDEWIDTYCTHLKARTVDDYRGKSKRYIVPYLGKVQLAALTPMQVQKFCNQLSNGAKGQKPLSVKTIQNIHGILHSALKQAVLSGIISQNPADNTKLPKVPYERLYILDLFSGLRQSEILGLQWEDVDFEAGELTVRRQLQKSRYDIGYIFLDETKNGKERVVTIPPSIVNVLRAQQRQQAEWKLAAGPA